MRGIDVQVIDVMTQAVITTTPQAPVKQAAALLATNGFTALPVVDQDDQLVGVVNEQDVVRDRIPPDARSRLWHPEQDSPDPPRTVGEVMSPPPADRDGVHRRRRTGPHDDRPAAAQRPRGG
jgi:CBS domain-containing protein